jgi:hypothetical protein
MSHGCPCGEDLVAVAPECVLCSRGLCPSCVIDSDPDLTLCVYCKNDQFVHQIEADKNNECLACSAPSEWRGPCSSERCVGSLQYCNKHKQLFICVYCMNPLHLRETKCSQHIETHCDVCRQQVITATELGERKRLENLTQSQKDTRSKRRDKSKTKPLDKPVMKVEKCMRCDNTICTKCSESLYITGYVKYKGAQYCGNHTTACSNLGCNARFANHDDFECYHKDCQNYACPLCKVESSPGKYACGQHQFYCAHNKHTLPQAIYAESYKRTAIFRNGFTRTHCTQCHSILKEKRILIMRAFFQYTGLSPPADILDKLLILIM